MVNIASCSRGATIGLVCDLHHIARSVLHQIGEERSIAVHDQKASTSHGPSITSPVSSTQIRKLPIWGKGRVDRRGPGRDGGRGHDQDGEGRRGEERSIAVHDQEASTSHGPSITSPVSSTQIRKLPI